MTRERLLFLVTNLAGIGLTVAPVFYPPAAILASPDVQAALFGAGALAVNVVRDIVQRVK